MKLRTKFILFIVTLHLIAIVLSFFVFKQNKILFLLSEVVIIISIMIAWQLYNQLIGPLQLLIQGADAIKDREFNVKLALTGKYEMDELIQVYNQMIEALSHERTRQEQQHFFLEKIISTSPTGILILDYDERIQGINPRGLKLLGIEEAEAVGKPVDQVAHPLMGEIKQLKSGEAKSVTLNGVTTFKLQKSHFIDRGFVRSFIMIEELTAEILAAEKKAYGKVIRMMAHEVNNTIGPVNSILQSALTSDKMWKNGDTDPLREALQVAFDRNRNLSSFMRNFADVVRLPEPKRETIDLHKLIRSISKFIEMLAGEKNIRFEYNFDESPFYIVADEQQMEQVLINIVKNSVEAIDKKGVISFISNPDSNELTITDNGRGIEQPNQLFSPFFSTKRDGQGIGLTLIKEILINHGYEFSLRTTETGKTEFIFRFLM